MGLNKEQQAAVEYLEGPLLVLAGPGTGKTQLLSAKVAYILQNIDVNPENILCLTFTEAGAQNMRDRLQTMIGKAALDVNIHTYHAFGANILDRYKNYAETFDRKLDAPIDDTMRYKIVHDIQKGLSAIDILKDAEVKEILDIISNAKSARLTAADLQKVAQQNIEDSQAISADVTPYLLELKPRAKFADALENTYQPILETLVKYSSDQPIVGNVERIANVLARELHQAITEASAEEKPKIKKLSDWKNKYFEAFVPNEKHPDEKVYRLKDYIANKKLVSLAHIMDKYDEKLRETGLFDFDDMIQCAIEYLKTDHGFRMQLSELFQYILLDEFQDTNASQFELIKLLTDYERPVVMAVGDDDQAIFAFQGANASNLRDFQEYYQAKVITLLDNYRSTGEILQISHQVAEQINDSFAKNYQINKTLRSMKDTWAQSSKPAVQVYRHEFPGIIAEYYWIAQRIRELVDAGEDPNEIAIIAPKHRNIIPLLPYLKAQNLDVTYEKRDNILLDPKISMLSTLAQFLQKLADRAQPADKLLEILSYDFWQVPPSVAVKAVEKNWGKEKSVIDYLAGDPQLESIANFFAKLAGLATTTPLELWLDYLMGSLELDGYTSPFLKYYQEHCSTAEMLEFYENLATLRQKVIAHAQNLNSNKADFVPKLADFVTALEDYQMAQTEIMRISIYRDSSRAIQVMTSHKSKGLEFKHVFLTSVDDSAWGKAGGNNNRFTLPKNLTFIRHTGITDDEQLRLFFVAITRAKEELIMTNSRQNADGGELKRLRYLTESSRDDAEQLSPFLLDSAKTIITHDGELTDQEKITTLQLNWVSAYQKLEPDTMELLRERMRDYRLSASDLTSFIDIIYAGPQQVYQNRVLRAPSEPADFSMCYGSILHTIFEKITSEGIDQDTALSTFRTEAAKAVLTDDEKSQLLTKGERSLKIALNEFDNILRQANAKAELNLSPEKLSYDGVPITGKIDHLSINSTDKTIEVYDFKTGNYHKEKWNSHPTLYKYRLQLGFYKLLLNLSPTYRNYQITRGHILFVTPDNDEKVYDKVYEFNPDDEQELKQLIKAVYRELQSLDFVDNPELFIPADKKHLLKDIKAFVAKLTENQ